jgi:hypothetical protein
MGLALVFYAAFREGSTVVRLAGVLIALLAVTVMSLGYGLGVAGKRISPLWGRTLDILEIVLILAVVPLAAWVWGLYSWIRAIGG